MSAPPGVVFRKSKKSKKKKKKKKSRVEVEDTAAAPQQVEENAEEDEYDDTISLAPGVGEERGDLMEIEFAFNDPSEGDFHSVRNLVRRSFFRSVLKAPAVKGGKKPSAADIAVALDANVSALADSIVGQIECCSLVQASKDDEEEDEFDEDETASSDATALSASVPSAGSGGTFGIMCALPLSLEKHERTEWHGALRAYIASKCPVAHREEIVALLSGRAAEGGTAALLCSLRLVNLPNELVPHMYDALCKDVEWVRANSVDAEHDKVAAKAFRFTQYLLLAPCVAPSKASGGGSSSSSSSSAGAPSKKKRKRNAGSAGSDGLSFDRFEMEHLYGLARTKFHFPLAMAAPAQGDGGGGSSGGASSVSGARHLAVMVISADAMRRTALPRIRSLVEGT
jgi:hypothetical protein